MIAALLYQPLTDLNIGCLEVGTSDVRASDVVPLKNGDHGLIEIHE